jgi:serine/threonine-protein kinase
MQNSVVRRISADLTTISTVAGTGTAGFSGDGGPASAASISGPRGITVAPDGTIFVADPGNFRIRSISKSGIIQTVGGVL